MSVLLRSKSQDGEKEAVLDSGVKDVKWMVWNLRSWRWKKELGGTAGRWSSSDYSCCPLRSRMAVQAIGDDEAERKTLTPFS